MYNLVEYLISSSLRYAKPDPSLILYLSPLVLLSVYSVFTHSVETFYYTECVWFTGGFITCINNSEAD